MSLLSARLAVIDTETSGLDSDPDARPIELAAVLLDVGAYQALLEENDLLRDIQHGLADVAAGRTVPHDEARARLLAKYRS